MGPGANAPDFNTDNPPDRGRRGDTTAASLARLSEHLIRTETRVDGLKETVEKHADAIGKVGEKLEALVRIETLLGTIKERMDKIEPKVDSTRYWIAGASAVAAVVVIVVQLLIPRIAQKPEPPIVNVYPNQQPQQHR